MNTDKKTVKSLLLFFLFSLSIFGIDEYFQFPEQSLPEKIEYEKSRKLCLFPFRSKVENEKFQYLANGIPSVIISNLNGFKYVYDADVLETVVYHAFGDQSKEQPAKRGKPVLNRKLNSLLDVVEKPALYVEMIVLIAPNNPKIIMKTPKSLDFNSPK